MLQVRISFRIPFLVIHAVENPVEGFLAEPQDRVQSAAECRRRNFTGIAWADGGYDVRVNDPGLHAVKLPIELQPVQIEVIRGQIRKLVSRGGETPLISQIVNREDRARCAPPPFRQFLVQNEHGHQPRLPIVQMHDLRFPG